MGLGRSPCTELGRGWGGWTDEGPVLPAEASKGGAPIHFGLNLKQLSSARRPSHSSRLTLLFQVHKRERCCAASSAKTFLGLDLMGHI